MRIFVNDVHIHVASHAGTIRDMPTLVLLHGFTLNAASWGDLLDKLAMPGMQVIALDMLGHGQSDAPSDPRRYSIEHCQADIIGVLQTLGIREAILLGYSMGARIALYTAFAGFFRAIILESASPGLADPAAREQRRMSDEELAARIEREGVAAFVEYWEHIPLFASQNKVAIEQRVELHAQRLANRADGLANSLRGVGTGAQPSLHAHLSELDLPTLLLAGTLDTKFCAIARQMAQQLPGAQLHIIPDAGHTVHLEQPDLFIRQVQAFCARVL